MCDIVGYVRTRARCAALANLCGGTREKSTITFIVHLRAWFGWGESWSCRVVESSAGLGQEESGRGGCNKNSARITDHQVTNTHEQPQRPNWWSQKYTM